MNAHNEQPADNLAAIMRHLVRAAEPDGDHEGLTPLQWSALRYLALANEISRTVSGFASYNATSKGTASQVIKTLVDKKLVRRERSTHDARSAQLLLTQDGQKVLENGGDNHLSAAIETLSDDERQHLERLLATLMGCLQPPQGRAQLGSCHDCYHLGEANGSPLCCRTGRQLTGKEPQALCAAHIPREQRDG